MDPNDPYYVGGTIIEGNVNEPVLSLGENSDASEIAGVTFRAGLVGIMGAGTDATIHNCRIIDNLTHGIELSPVSRPHLLDCLITANGQAGIKMHETMSGRWHLLCEPVIENCYIVGNSDGSIIGGQPVILNSVIDGQ